MRRWPLAAWALVILAAVGLRAPRLDLRPMHNDEGVNAVKFGQLYVKHTYIYNPNEFHGPTLPYFTLPAAWLQGGGPFEAFGPATFRSVTVLFGLGLVLLPWLLRRDLGQAEACWAAGLTAISPAMVYYSRDYIHETLLVFFTALTFIAAWRSAGRMGWTILAGVSLGLMTTTKETFGFTLVALGLAFLCAQGRAALRCRQSLVLNLPRIALALVIAAIVAVVFYSSFFTNWNGLEDALRTYLPWLRRAGGGATPHVHPWYFYFRRLFWFRANGGPLWSEAFIGILGMMGFLQALRSTILLHRLIAFYTLWLTVIYAALPYKTPWCLLGFYDGLIFLGGIGAIALWRRCHRKGTKTVLAIILAAGAAQLAVQAGLQNFAADRSGVPYCASAKCPYVYSQTSPDFLRLVETVDGLARVSPYGYQTQIEVVSPQSYWPLPWYLRRFKSDDVGYFSALPAPPYTPIVIVDASLQAALDERPERTYLMAGYFQLRPDVFLELYVNTNLWTRYVKSLPAPSE